MNEKWCELINLRRLSFHLSWFPFEIRHSLTDGRQGYSTFSTNLSSRQTLSSLPLTGYFGKNTIFLRVNTCIWSYLYVFSTPDPPVPRGLFHISSKNTPGFVAKRHSPLGEAGRPHPFQLLRKPLAFNGKSPAFNDRKYRKEQIINYRQLKGSILHPL